MADRNFTPSTPPRVAVDRRALPVLLALGRRLRPFQLTIETDRYGDTRAYLQRQAVQQ